MRVLVASNGHGLLPFAWRLRREEADVETLVFRDRCEAAWEGTPLGKAARGKDKGKATLRALAELAEAGEMVVLTDSNRGLKAFAQGRQVFPRLESIGEGRGPLALGAWFDGEKLVLPHLVLNDWGLWPGGLGPAKLGGMVLVNQPTSLHERLEPLGDQLKAANFKGLVSAQVALDPASGGPVLGQVDLGWPELHSEAFLSDMDSLRALLAGEPAGILARFVVALPVTVPPYPVGTSSEARPVEGLAAEDLKTIFFHDFQTNGNHEIQTAGLDGYLCVVRGSGPSLALARQRALGVAAKLRVAEKQVRYDAAAGADLMLGMLEELGMLGS